MRVSISTPEPEILQEAEIGELFLVHNPELQECVCALFNLLDMQAQAVEQRSVVVVIGCRVGVGEPGYLKPGNAITCHNHTPISRLQQVETAHFRGIGDARRSHAACSYPQSTGTTT